MSRPVFPIESPHRLAHLLGISKVKLCELAMESSELYVQMLLMVHGKEPRPIRIPRDELRAVQHRILRRLFCDFVPHACSSGGVKGRSARYNAEMHLGSPFILKVDVRKFYPSIHHRWVQHFFERRLHCSPPVANILRRLLTLDAGLPQGTCTSPALSDQMMKPIDRIFASVFAKADATYSRFVDDITISGSFRLRDYVPFMHRVLKRFGLRRHPEKTQEIRPGDEAIITGFACGKRIGLPSSYLNQVSSELDQALSFSRSAGGAPPPYCRESYWGTIEYIRRVDRLVGNRLLRVFSNIRWSAFEALNLPRKKGVLHKCEATDSTARYDSSHSD